MTNTHKIIEVIYRGVADYYEVHWKCAIQTTLTTDKHKFYKPKSLATYIMADALGRDATCDILEITYGQVNHAYQKVMSTMWKDEQLRKFIEHTHKQINAVR